MTEPLHRQEVTDFVNARESDISGHLELLYDITFLSDPKLVVELGVRSGFSTFALSRACMDTKAKLISVDFIDCQGSCDWDEWIFIRSDDIVFGTTFKEWCGQHQIETPIDVLFVDTSHTYNHTIQEIKTYLPHMADHHFMVFHDTNPHWTKPGWHIPSPAPAVNRAIEDALNLPTFNWDERFIYESQKYEISHFPEYYGFTVVWRKPHNDEHLRQLYSI